MVRSISALWFQKMSEEYKKVKSGKLKLKGDGSEERRKAKKKAKKEKKARKRKLNEGKDEDEEAHGGWYIVSDCSSSKSGTVIFLFTNFLVEVRFYLSERSRQSRRAPCHNSLDCIKSCFKQIIFIFGDNLGWSFCPFFSPLRSRNCEKMQNNREKYPCLCDLS